MESLRARRPDPKPEAERHPENERGQQAEELGHAQGNGNASETREAPVPSINEVGDGKEDVQDRGQKGDDAGTDEDHRRDEGDARPTRR